MISRLTAIAAVFSALATVSLAYATSAPQHQPLVVAKAVPVVQLPTVVITAKRIRATDN